MAFFLAFAFALALTPAARRIGLAAGLADQPGAGGLKIHAQPIPVLGGVAVVVATAGALALLGAAPVKVVAAAVAVALATGLIDDARPLPPSLRVALLAGAGAMLIAWAPRLPLPGAVAAIALVLLLLACANAVNLIDGQDGLAGGLAAIAALGLVVLAVRAGGWPDGELGLALAGALTGFLVWNRPPARIFLGNSGAYAVGALLAVLAATVATLDGWRGLLAAGICLGPFAFELAFTVARRLASGNGLATGDRNHSYDLLARTGGRTRATLVLWTSGALAAATAVLIGSLPLALGAAVAAAAIVIGALIGFRLWARASPHPTSSTSNSSPSRSDRL
jgi:UDP-GlcNAc:undecaprenyl-phosphate/decaprenyl-phosphate GlcNAc-1-phosphate transferase